MIAIPAKLLDSAASSWTKPRMRAPDYILERRKLPVSLSPRKLKPAKPCTPRQKFIRKYQEAHAFLSRGMASSRARKLWDRKQSTGKARAAHA